MITTEQWARHLNLRGVRTVDLREDLTTSPSRQFATRDPEAIEGLVIHHAAGEVDGEAGVEAMARYHSGPNHISPRGCPGLCYTAAIGRDGTVYLANDLDRATWSQGDRSRPGDENGPFLGVVVLGNFAGPHNPGATGEPTLAQIDAVIRVYLATGDALGWKPDEARLFGHFDFSKPACPGATLQAVILAHRANARGSSTKHDLDIVAGRQAALAELGLDPGPIDGAWGPRSRAALVEFQRAEDLVADGVFGPLTRAAMARALGGES